MSANSSTIPHLVEHLEIHDSGDAVMEVTNYVCSYIRRECRPGTVTLVKIWWL